MTIRIPEHLRALVPYVPGKPIEEVERQLGIPDAVKLASNENPLGPSPLAVAAIRESAARVHRYPDGGGYELRRVLAARFGLQDSQIVLGNGSTEIVEMVAKAFLARDCGAVVADQAFIMYRIAVQSMNAPLRIVPLKDNRHDLLAMAAACDASTSLVYIANPNNPSGTYVGREAMEDYFARVPDHVLTVIDEAYLDYVDSPDFPAGIDLLSRGRNVVILHTFSKIYGLAGIRIGYALTRTEIASALEAVRSPFNTSIPAQAAALAALDDTEHLGRSRSANREGIRFLEEELHRRGVEFVPTVANFLLIRTFLKGEELYQNLLRLGVIVRPMAAYGYEDAIRVSIGRLDELRRFLDAFDQVVTPAASSGSGVSRTS